MKRLTGKPFALLGVNSDGDREELKKTLEEEKINWRSWWDEGKVDGPIHAKFRVEQRPAIFVLDAEGVIRFRDLVKEELDRAVDGLLEERAGKSGK